MAPTKRARTKATAPSAKGSNNIALIDALGWHRHWER
jgi:hypothetical protein